jgi:hypothetical protein
MNFLGRLEQKVTITVSSHELPKEEIVLGVKHAKPRETVATR